MPYNSNDLVREISTIIQKALDDDVIMPAPSVQLAVMRDHVLPKLPKIDSRDFYLHCTNAHVREQVHKVLKRFKEPDPLERELTLPGFKFLQKGYLVKRECRIKKGRKYVSVLKESLVPITRLTDEELEAKALEYEAMAVGCRKHAAELRRYKSERKLAA